MAREIRQLDYFGYYSDWQLFIERLELYLDANEITEEKRKAIPLTSINDKAYDIFT